MFLRMAMCWIAGLAAATPSARAKNKPALKALFEIKLDIDRDGKMDRAVLTGPAESEIIDGEYFNFMLGVDEHVDLYNYSAVGMKSSIFRASPRFSTKTSSIRQGLPVFTRSKARAMDR